MSLEGVTLIHLWRCSWCINCLHSTVALLVVHFRTTFKWVSLQHKCAFSSFVVLFQQMNNCKVFLRGLCCVQMQEESLPFMKKNMVLQEWLGVWTACTCSGRIALWPGKALKWERQVSQPLFWRSMLLITTCGFGITPLDGQDQNIWNWSCLLKAFLDGSFASNVDFEFTPLATKYSNACGWLLMGFIPS